MKIYVRRKSNQEIINEADVTDMNVRQIEDLMTKVSQRLDHRQFYIDDHEIWGKLNWSKTKKDGKRPSPIIIPN